MSVTDANGGAMSSTILVCDNEQALRTLVRAALDGYDVVEARTWSTIGTMYARLFPDPVTVVCT
jgi:hypothetical protein